MSEAAQAAPPAPLAVAVSMLSLVPGGMGGSETYARELLTGLAADPRVDATAWVSRAGAELAGLGPTRVVAGVAGGPSTRERVSTLLSARRHRREVLAGWAAADVVHFPVTAPVPWPARRGPAWVQSLLDTQHLDLPELFSPAERLYRRRYYEHAARTADRVVTISDFARDQIVAHLGIDPARITVAPLGVDVTAFTPYHGPREEFVLYPARGWAHKNHRRLVEAMTLVRRTHPDLRLVLTGGGLETLGPLPEWVDVRGLVPLAELRDLLRRASALVFPSLYEGFGLPPLEAMASGCPVAASDAGSLPEVCGDAAVLFDARDPEAIAAGVERALADADALSAGGPAQAARFTWRRCVDAHVDAYRAAAEARA